MIDSASEALRVRVQNLFGPDLVVGHELGRGGMAAVFAAHDPALQRRVAVKVLLPELADDQAIADRFLREGRTMASLDHPNVVSVYTVRGDRDINAIVMQFVDGTSLDQMLRRPSDRSLAQGGRILAQVTKGLQHAHARGVVHRDVKPANVLVDAEGRALVSDFGIARRDDGFDVTKTGMVLGTSDYMSPEQRSGERVTPATDQYALGVMAYEVLCGRPPFIGTTLEMVRGHMLESPPSMRTLRPDIPEAVDDVVVRMLAKAPSDRLATLDPILAAFESLATARTSNEQGDAIQPASASVPPVGAAAAPQRRIGAGASVAVAIVAVAVAIGAGVWRMRPTTPSTGPATLVASPSTAAPPSVSSASRGQMSPGAVSPGAVSPGTSTGASGPTREGAMSVKTPRSAAGDSASAPNAAAATPQRTVNAAASNPPAVSPSTVSPAPGSPPSAPSVSAPQASLSDARAMGRQLVTLLNQRRTRELAALSPAGGSATARAELLRLAERADDFAVGFDRLPSVPTPTATGFESECYLDVEWRGGHTTMRVMMIATHADDGWRLVAFGVDSP